MQLCKDCGADVATTGHFDSCPTMPLPETDPRYADVGDAFNEATLINRVTKTPKTPNPDYLPDGPTSPRWGKGRPA